MAKGFDTTEDCTALAATILGAGYDFVARYLSKFSSKTIKPAEAAALSSAGLKIVLVYEDGPTMASYFTPDRGIQDGTRASIQAKIVGAPSGTCIYFAVDFDASESEIQSSIIPYFQAVNNILKGVFASDNLDYIVGVYGSGSVCSTLTSSGLANFGWMACSTGWSGYHAFHNWTILQSLPTVACGVSVDPNIAVSSYGCF